MNTQTPKEPSMDNIKQVFNKITRELLVEFINNKYNFSMIVSSKNWINPLPERLKDQEYFIIQVKEQTMDDSYVIENNGKLDIYINTEFDGMNNSLLVYDEDVKGILDITMQNPLVLKPYIEEPYNAQLESVKKTYKTFPVDDMSSGVKHSLECFVKNNPNMFGENVGN